MTANNEEYYINLDNLFLLGDSAGGQLTQQYPTIASNPNYQNLFDFQVPNIQFNAVGLNCGAYYIGNNIGSADDFPYYLDGKMTDQLKAQLPVEQYITTNFPPAFVMTSSHDFLRETGIQFDRFLISKGNEVYFKIYQNPDGTPLNHVFHIDQKHLLLENVTLTNWISLVNISINYDDYKVSENIYYVSLTLFLILIFQQPF